MRYSEFERKMLEDNGYTLTAPCMRRARPDEYPENGDFVMASYGMDRTPGGRLWLAWTAGGDDANGYGVAGHSDDDGRSWSRPDFVVRADPTPHGLRRRHSGGQFWCDPLGRMWFFVDYTLEAGDGRIGWWYARCDNPEDDHPEWSGFQRMAHGSSMAKVLVLGNGTWLTPVCLWRREISCGGIENLARELDPWRKTWIYASTDQGESWQRRGGAEVPDSTWNEPQLVALADGRLKMAVRTANGFSWTLSADEGHSWSSAVPSGLATPDSRIMLRRLSSGRLLLVANILPEGVASKKRERLTALLSDDDGESWHSPLLLDPRVGVSYPDGFQAPDGRIFVVYDHLRTNGALCLAVFGEADLMAGRPINATTALRRPIIETRNYREVPCE